MAGEIHEKCAVAGFVGEGATVNVAQTLFALQHRGQEATGMVSQTFDGKFDFERKTGLVSHVYNDEVMARLAGNLAIGHDRYSTNGSRSEHKQPVIDENIGFALGHNGNLPVTELLEDFLNGHHVRTEHLNDSEMLGLAISQYIRQGKELPDAVEIAYPLFRGAFSAVALHGDLMVGFRDSKGIRPLAIGENEDGFALSSETVGIDIIGANYIQEVPPGAMVVISKSGIEEIRHIVESQNKLDMFEFVYFARPDSILYDQRVGVVRDNMGKQLAEQHPPITDDVENIVVVPVPDTSTSASEAYAEALGLKHKLAIQKSRYIGRTFIQPPQTNRQASLNRKHHLIPDYVKGRDVIFIDDSIVRLNTMPRLVEQAWQAGAKTVSALVASSPVRFPDFYGIDTPSQNELAAANMTIEQMRMSLGVNMLGYLSLSRMIEATGLPADMFNLSPFTGDYPIGIGKRKKEISNPVSMEFID